jgi:hypothetical protein
MTGRDRKRWLSEISRIHEEEQKTRQKEMMEQIHQVVQIRKDMEEQEY